MNEQTLELQIKSKAQEAKSSVDSLVKSLTNVENVLTNIYSKIGSIEKNGLKTTVTNVNQLKQTTDKATTSANKLGKALSLGGTYLGAKRLTMQMLGWMNEAVDFTEQLNLFNVVFDNVEKNGVKTFSELGKSATQFQYKLNEAFGTNKTQSLYMQGIFQSMGETVGIDDKYSAIMSETMTKLTYDLASLYNKSEKTTAEAIRAGVYAGQTKPLRSYGIDVTQQSLQPILDSLGIDEQVKNMSQAEKEILRYLATLKQAQIAMGDLANTIESPSNQLKIFRQQLVEAKVALSSLFIGTFAKILPYANAILMVIKEVSKAIASMFGIKITDYNSGIASNDSYSDSLDDIGTSANNASKKVKELKRQTLGFDEIHNINENKDNGAGSDSSGGVSGGIDQRLLDAITGYDNGMDKVRMKAAEIRDKIMEWLGFTKEIDPLTGEVSFKYQGIKTTLSNIVDWWRSLNTEGKIWTSLGLALGFVKLFKIMRKIADLTGITTLFKLLISFGDKFKSLGIIKGLTNLIEYTKIYTSLANGNLLKGIKGGTTAWLNQNSVLTKSNLIIAMVVAGWTSFIKQYKNNKKFRDSVNEISKAIANLKIIVEPLKKIFQSLFGYVKKVCGSAITAVDTVVNNFVSTVSLPFNMFNKLITGDFKGMLDTATGYAGNFFNNLKNVGIAAVNILPFVHIETEAEKFAKTMKKIEKEIFNNGGISIKEYKKSLDELLSKIVNDVPNVDKYNQIIKDSKASYEGAKDSLSVLLTQMQTDAYQVTADDISKLNTVLDTMSNSVKESGQAFTDATTAIVNHLVKEGKISEEQALRVVKSAQMKAQAENNRVEEYRLKMIELNNQLERGEITQEQFSKKQMELTKQFNTTSDSVEVAKNSIKNYANYINQENLISTKSWKELNSTIGEMGNTFETNKKELEANYKSQKEILEQSQLYWKNEIEQQNKTLENLKRTKGEESIEYQNAKNVLEDYQANYQEVSNSIIALNSQKKDDVKSLKQTTVEALLGIVATLKKSGYDMNKDSEGTVRSINKQLKRLGVKEEVDLNQNMKQITKSIDNQLGTNTSQTVKNTNWILSKIGQGISPVIKVSANIDDADYKVKNWINRINGTINATLGIFGVKRANGGVYSNGSWKDIPQYANGGSPSHGSMFIAGEHGAEIVGHINGKTEVLNQSQIASAIYSAMINAMSQYGGGGVAEINVHADEGIIVETAINGINQRTNQTGVCPVKIPAY